MVEIYVVYVFGVCDGCNLVTIDESNHKERDLREVCSKVKNRMIDIIGNRLYIFIICKI